MDLLDFGLPPLSHYVPDATFETVLRHARRVRFKDGQELQERGDLNIRLCLVADGAVRLGRIQPSGRFNLVAIFGVGAHFGDLAIQSAANTLNGYAVGSTEIDVIALPVVKQLLRDEPDFAAGLSRCNAVRMNALLELYDDARTLGVTERLAKTIYIHRGRGALAGGIACIQRDLANLLGVTQVSIGNSLKELEREGLIETGYRFVKVPDEEKLKAWLQSRYAI